MNPYESPEHNPVDEWKWNDNPWFYGCMFTLNLFAAVIWTMCLAEQKCNVWVGWLCVVVCFCGIIGNWKLLLKCWERK